MTGRNWVLAAMIFAVSMTFIDQTIVSIAVPDIQRELGLTSTGVQWVVNGYLISLAALFFGIAGGLRAIGPLLGGYLTQWTWRAIFWVNIPVAIIALVLIAVSKPKTQYRKAPLDYP